MLVAIVMNTMPLITAILGYFILNEQLKLLEKICMAISFFGVAVMITGKDGGSTSNIAYPLYAVIALFMNPFFSSLVTITLRSMRNMSAHTQGFYHAFGMSIVMGVIILFTRDYIEVMNKFILNHWLWLFGSAVSAYSN